jgi:hypothetical protein
MTKIHVLFGAEEPCEAVEVSAEPITIGGIEFMLHRYVAPVGGGEAVWHREGKKDFGPTRVKSLSRQGLHICSFPYDTQDVKAWLLRRVRETFPDAEGKTDKNLFIDKLVAHMWAYRKVAPHVTREFIRDERRYLENRMKVKQYANEHTPGIHKGV